MKTKYVKQILAILLSVLMLLTVAPLSSLTNADLSGFLELKAEASTSYKVGDLIKFGSYPQSEVKDSVTLDTLNKTKTEWISYGYYSGNGNYGSMAPSDFMFYRDVTVGGVMYRGVRFSLYRPRWNEETAGSEYKSCQSENGYEPNAVYWFRFEPVTWRILDPSDGLVISESILDAQAYNNYMQRVFDDYNDKIYYFGDSGKTYFASNYAKSSIRNWLNDDFYNTAFNVEEKANIKPTLLETTSTYSTEYDSPATEDRIFLLSVWDMVNTNYGFSDYFEMNDAARLAKGSDYAKAQGLLVSEKYDGNSWWFLRSPCSSYEAGYVDCLGNTKANYMVCHSDYGIRPACKLLKLPVEEPVCKTEGHKWDSGKVTKEPTYKAKGEKIFTCTVCGETKKESIAKLIAPTVAKVSGLKASKVKTNIITLKWNKAKNADKYNVYRSTDGKKWTKITVTTKLTYTDKDVKAGTKYQYKVIGIHSASKAKGEYSSVLKTGTLTAAPKISSLKSAKAKTATVSWKKVTGAKSYIVYTSKDNSKWTKALTTVKTTATLSKLTAGKKVYVKLLAVNAYGKNSAYSAVKSVTVKK